MTERSGSCDCAIAHAAADPCIGTFGPTIDDVCPRCKCCTLDDGDDCWQCGGDGAGVIDCCDDLCQGTEDDECMHGDGHLPCDECGGTGRLPPLCGGRCDAAGQHARPAAVPAPNAVSRG